MIKLEGICPDLKSIARLGSNPLLVYSVLFESAQQDNRGDCGGTTSWSIKGLSNELGIERRTVTRSLEKLLDNGHIQIAGELQNKGGSNQTIWRVTHPKMLDAVLYSIEIMGKPSLRLKKMRTKQKKVDTSKYQEPQYSWDI